MISGSYMLETPAIIIPNWNGKSLLGKCLKSLEHQSPKPHIIVVDNGSSDGSAAFIKTKYPDVELIELVKNHGFAGGVNIGFKAALKQGYEFIGLINNDATADKHWLRNLVRATKQSSKIGIAASKILKTDKTTIYSTGEVYSIWGTPFPRGYGEQDLGQYDDQTTILAASGGAVLYRATMLKAIGLFDERFFAYYEDVDLSLRAQLAGWRVNFVPDAKIFHIGSATSSKLGTFADYHRLKNYFYLYFKNIPGRIFWKYLITASIGFWGRLVTLVARGEIWVVVKAIGIIIINTPGIIISRIKIQNKRKLDTAKFDSMLLHQPSPVQKSKLPFRWFF